MEIYLSDKELCSKSFKPEVVGDAMLKVKSRWVVKDGENRYYDPDSDKGKELLANKNGKSVNEIADMYELAETNFTKKEYLKHMKKYIGKVEKKLANKEEELKQFQKKGAKFIKTILKWIRGGEVSFYFTGAFADGMVILEKYEGQTPYFYFWKHGSYVKKY